MKVFFEFLFLAIFFAVYKLFGIYPAIFSAIVLYGGQIGFLLLRYKRVEKIQVITFLMILILGGASLFFQNELFFKWKPSVVYWLFAIAIIGAQRIRKAPSLQALLGQAIELPMKQWYAMDMAWALFFTVLGFVNLFVAYQFTTNTWVYFKLFGTLGAFIVFMVIQVIWLARYAKSHSTD